jgi:hypothetical protein
MLRLVKEEHPLRANLEAHNVAIFARESKQERGRIAAEFRENAYKRASSRSWWKVGMLSALT